MKEKHLILNVYNCLSCEFKTTVLEDFKIHVDTTHLSVKVKVKKNNVSDVKEPVPDQTQSIAFYCTQCDYKCGLRIKLQKHCRSKHEMQQCDACPYRTNELEKMAEHKASKHALVDFYCNICEFTARTPYVLLVTSELDLRIFMFQI